MSECKSWSSGTFFLNELKLLKQLYNAPDIKGKHFDWLGTKIVTKSHNKTCPFDLIVQIKSRLKWFPWWGSESGQCVIILGSGRHVVNRNLHTPLKTLLVENGTRLSINHKHALHILKPLSGTIASLQMEPWRGSKTLGRRRMICNILCSMEWLG